MTTYTIHPIVVGTKVFDKSMMTYQHGAGETYTIPIYCWYIKGGNQNILVDTGEICPIQSEARQKSIGGKIYTFEEGLARFGLTPDAIDIVIHTHLHNDHCENDYKCTNAKVYVHELELKRIHNPHPLDFRYLEDYILEVEENDQLQIMKEDTQVVPGIRCVHTPVHTDGGMSVVIDTQKGKAVITGFCVIQENFEPPKEVRAMEMDVIPPGTLVNSFEAYDIMLQIKAMADILLPLHEPAFASVESIP
ncbi:N-acyl homoserine lactonase family protein [Desulforhopalus sp. IMCC35007]|uniref:N-acyl homoserine lactonase family protein n=1 Tax=Desulforhopalus sp. IMCC35007 TaxID=2569543 RepID=UPI0010AE1051|nr:N-acyl homoserine lactonase family protein [Desulforhopalus sp. IMCC35007]TKB08186.1 N-acyl homoserine lactonase family protein [Desulforhopalus sp. IMCC35007]